MMPRAAALASAVLLAAGVVALAGAPATAASPDVAISQVYGGGGNAGATFTNDFIELRNTSGSAVDVTGWSVQYASAAGAHLPGHHAVRHRSRPAATTWSRSSPAPAAPPPLPTPDATGTIAMSATSGKVALVITATALTCAADCDTAAGVKDFVGYGAANDFETAAAPTPVQHDRRPARRRARTPTTTPPTSPPATRPRATPPATATPRRRTRAYPAEDPRHPGRRAPLALARRQGRRRAGRGHRGVEQRLLVPGPELRTRTRRPARACSCSPGPPPAAAVGDAVTVTGLVAEFRPGGAATNLTTTELTSPTVTVTASAQPLPPAIVVGPGGLVPPATVIENDASGDVETTETAFDPAADGLDFWESLEGERISHHRRAGRRSDEHRSARPRSSRRARRIRTNRGGIVARATDFNPERIVIADDAGRRADGRTSATPTPAPRSASSTTTSATSSCCRPRRRRCAAAACSAR